MECMEFPDTFDKFAEQYGFIDKGEYYTNGSHLIPVFRVNQWLEHHNAQSQSLSLTAWNVQLQIPLDAVSDIIKVVEKG